MFHLTLMVVFLNVCDQPIQTEARLGPCDFTSQTVRSDGAFRLDNKGKGRVSPIPHVDMQRANDSALLQEAHLSLRSLCIICKTSRISSRCPGRPAEFRGVLALCAAAATVIGEPPAKARRPLSIS
jgi:hypothetical protein